MSTGIDAKVTVACLGLAAFVINTALSIEYRTNNGMFIHYYLLGM